MSCTDSRRLILNFRASRYSILLALPVKKVKMLTQELPPTSVLNSPQAAQCLADRRQARLT